MLHACPKCTFGSGWPNMPVFLSHNHTKIGIFESHFLRKLLAPDNPGLTPFYHQRDAGGPEQSSKIKSGKSQDPLMNTFLFTMVQ
jgi:hypothetical protein